MENRRRISKRDYRIGVLKAFAQKLYNKQKANRKESIGLYNSVGPAIPYQVARQQSLALFDRTIKNIKIG